MTFDRVRAMLAEQLRIDAGNISLSSDIVKDLKADSLDMFNLVMCLEDEFSIELSDEDASRLKTVQDVVEFIDKL